MPQRAIAGVPAPWVAAAATAAAALAVWVTLSADFLAHPGWLAAQKADIILGPVLVGLYWMRRRPESRFGPLLVAFGFVAGAPFLLQSSSEPVLYCCLEALQNATKHAGAEARIVARLCADEEELRVEVSDDGPGFDVGAVNGGVGLRNMEDRLGAVRGRLVITTSPGNGTLIAGVVPISASVSEPVSSLAGDRDP